VIQTAHGALLCVVWHERQLLAVSLYCYVQLVPLYKIKVLIICYEALASFAIRTGDLNLYLLAFIQELGSANWV
jgi:hypothetical protein